MQNDEILTDLDTLIAVYRHLSAAHEQALCLSIPMSGLVYTISSVMCDVIAMQDALEDTLKSAIEQE